MDSFLRPLTSEKFSKRYKISEGYKVNIAEFLLGIQMET